MLPVLFTITIPPSLGIAAWVFVSLLSGFWQWRSARKAGEAPAGQRKTLLTWTLGTAVLLFAAVKLLGGQNILHLERPLAIPIHTYGILVAGGFLVAMTMAGRAAQRPGLDQDKVLDLSFGIPVAPMIASRPPLLLLNL